MINRKYIEACYQQAESLYKQASALEKRAGALDDLSTRVKTLPVISDIIKAVKRGKAADASAQDLISKQVHAAGIQETGSAEDRRMSEAADAAADVAKREKDAAIKAAAITGGGIAAGGVAGGLLGRYLAPEKYRRLATALGILTGAAVGGTGAHLGQKLQA